MSSVADTSWQRDGRTALPALLAQHGSGAVGGVFLAQATKVELHAGGRPDEGLQ